MLPYTPDLAVIDVSFISLRKILPAVLGCCAKPRRARDDQAAIRGRQAAARQGRGRAIDRGPRARRSSTWGCTRSAWASRCSDSSARGCPGPRATARVHLARRGRASLRGGAHEESDCATMRRLEVEPVSRQFTVFTHRRPDRDRAPRSARLIDQARNGRDVAIRRAGDEKHALRPRRGPARRRADLRRGRALLRARRRRHDPRALRPTPRPGCRYSQ